VKKYLLSLPIILGIIVLISIPTISAQSETNEIPSWIKGVANFWIEGGIDDADFIEALEFLIDNNVIKLGENIVVNNTMSVITQEQKDILDLTISQKEDRIKILENEVKDIGLDNSKLLVSVVELQENNNSLQISLTETITEFDTYKKDYPLKVGNIGGKLVNVDTIRNLENQLQDYEQTIEELKVEIRQLKDQ